MSITPDSVHLEQQVVALARALADAREHRDAAVLARELWISSWISTVLPTPAPPNRPILPPRTYGAIRSTTLMPVSKISIFGVRSLNAGGSRWIGQRSASSGAAGLLVDRLADDVPEAAQRHVADRNEIGAAGVEDVRAAREAVGGVHRDRADAVVAEVLLHLGDRSPPSGRVISSAREDLGQLVREDGVDHDALDLDELAGVLPALPAGQSGSR